MNDDERREALLHALDEALKEGHRQVPIASVRTLVEGIWKTSPPVDPKDAAAQRLEDFKFDLAIRREVFKQVFPFGHEATKCAVLMNAGAVAALLAFVGSLVGKGEKATATLLASAILYFVLGVVAGAVCWGAAYVSQSLYAHRPETPWGHRLLGLAVTAWTGSIALFVMGGWTGYRVLAGLAVS